MKTKVTPERITSLKPQSVFVFGSNEAGIHGAGAALFANRAFHRPYGTGFGPHKAVDPRPPAPPATWTFAIPTKDWAVERLPLDAIRHYVRRFIEYTKLHPEMTFYVTPIGCGLAGYFPGQIAPMFAAAPLNVALPMSFIEVLGRIPETVPVDAATATE